MNLRNSAVSDPERQGSALRWRSGSDGEFAHGDLGQRRADLEFFGERRQLLPGAVVEWNAGLRSLSACSSLRLAGNEDVARAFRFGARLYVLHKAADLRQEM